MNEFSVALAEFISVVIRGAVALLFSAVILPWVVKYAIPWLKEKQLYGTIRKFVRAAEKLGESGTISKTAKLDYVIALLQKKGVTVDPSVRALIESAVGDLDDEVSHGLMSLVEALNTADDASVLVIDKNGRPTVAELDSRGDEDDPGAPEPITNDIIDSIIDENGDGIPDSEQ